MASASRRPTIGVIVAGTVAAYIFLSGSGALFSVPNAPPVLRGTRTTAAGSRASSWTTAEGQTTWAGLSLGALLGAATSAAVATWAWRGVPRNARGEAEETNRRDVLISAMAAAAAALAAEEAAEAQPSGYQAPLPPVDLPDRINADPYELIGMENTEEKKQDYKFFFMKKKYRDDCYQVMKHMKISASLDKGTPNMEKWNKRVKEEMNDWLALYRRQDKVVGRQSYYSLYSAVNTLASHFSSYGPKFPFPNKRRPRFFELVNITEKYLEKGK